MSHRERDCKCMQALATLNFQYFLIWHSGQSRSTFRKPLLFLPHPFVARVSDPRSLFHEAPQRLSRPRQRLPRRFLVSPAHRATKSYHIKTYRDYQEYQKWNYQTYWPWSCEPIAAARGIRDVGSRNPGSIFLTIPASLTKGHKE